MKKNLICLLALCMFLFLGGMACGISCPGLSAPGLAEPVFAEDDVQDRIGSPPKYTEYSDLQGKTVGLLTGAPFEELIESKVGKVKHFEYFNSVADMQLALMSGKIDAYMTSNAVAELQVSQDSRIAIFPKSFGDSSFGFAFRKKDPAEKIWRDAVAKVPDETKDRLWKKWTGADEDKKTLPEQDWPGKNGTVKIAACDTLPPMSYAGENDKPIGYDMELLLLMAKDMDVHLVFQGMEFSSLMAYVQAGKADFASGSIIVTDERKKAMDFVEYAPAAFMMVVMADEDAGAGGFWEGIKESFKRTFIIEKRYEMILSGLAVTVSIAIAAGVLGLILAFALVFVRHRNRRFFNGIIAIYGKLVAGIPAVVILMIMYYIVFGAVNLPAVIVAIVGFALIFGARAYEVIWNAVCTVDDGQREAALALGYNDNLAFRDIILPQSKDYYMPLLQAQFITLVKETSIVGYITALDLTRAGDLIRSRTMEAFFPLLAIALIYFLLTWLLGVGLGRINVYHRKKKEARKIKGVDR